MTEMYGFRTAIATAPVTAVMIDRFIRDLHASHRAKSEETEHQRVKGAVFFVFAHWCGHCAAYVESYNRLVSLLPVMANVAVCWATDRETGPLRQFKDNPVVQQMGAKVKFLPSVFFIDDKGDFVAGSVEDPEKLIAAYFTFNAAARDHAARFFWPQLLGQKSTKHTGSTTPVSDSQDNEFLPSNSIIDQRYQHQ